MLIDAFFFKIPQNRRVIQASQTDPVRRMPSLLQLKFGLMAWIGYYISD